MLLATIAWVALTPFAAVAVGRLLRMRAQAAPPSRHVVDLPPGPLRQPHEHRLRRASGLPAPMVARPD